VSGMDIVKKIAKLPTGSNGSFSDVPRDAVLIEAATALPQGK